MHDAYNVKFYLKLLMSVNVMMVCDGVWFGGACPKFRRNPLPVFCTVVMKAVDISEKLVRILEYLRRHIPEDRNTN